MKILITVIQSTSEAYARRSPGLGSVFIAIALLKLKAHKNNPDQIPIGVAEFRNDLANFLSDLPK